MQLYEKINLKKKINTISNCSLTEAVTYAFSNDKFKFYLNSELIDVKDRFRIFRFHQKVYIAKKTTEEDGKNELKYALLAKEKLTDVTLPNYQLKVIEPVLLQDEQSYYILTEYHGTSLQELVYKNEKSSLSIDTLFTIMNAFLDKGILYRGFLPRNTVIQKDTIYLLDWEDTIYTSHPKEIGVNQLWLTNFLLNWCYFYPLEELKKRLLNYKNTSLIEPELLKYEKNFGSCISCINPSKSIRDTILETVLFAEKPLYLDKNIFYIPPNDLAHLVSDLFNSDIDVLFDISSYVLRKAAPQKYASLVELLSNVIIECYQKQLPIPPKAILVILMLFEETTLLNRNNKFEEISDSLIYLEGLTSYDLVTVYQAKSKENFEKRLEYYLNQILDNYNRKKPSKKLIHTLSQYIWNLK